MNINDIIKLNNEHENLNIITSFLNTHQNQEDYERALLKYIQIASSLNLDELLLKEANKYLVKLKDLKATKYRENIYDSLFESALKVKDFSLSKTYLNNKKELLKEMDKYKSTLDEIKYLKATNEDYFDQLISLKKEVIPNETLIYVNEELYNYYFNLKDYYNSLKILNELYEDTLNVKYENEMIKIYFLMENYEKVITSATNLMNENSNNLYTVIFLISSLRIQKNYRRATSIEAEYEIAIESSNDYNLKLFAFNEIIKLYEDTNNTLSINLYKDKLKKLNRDKKVLEKKQTIKEPEIKIKEIKTKTLISDAQYLKYFNWINEWLIYSNNKKINIRFREYLRDLFIKIDEKIQFKDVVLYINNNNESNFYHYKKERLFDKKVTKFYLENTIIETTIKNKKAIFSKPNNLISKKDVLTQKDYKEEVKYVYSIYVNEDFVILFYFEEEIKDPGLIYELLNGIALIINIRLIDEEKVKELNKDSKYLEILINNPVIPMRKLTKSRSFYNDEATKLFNIDEYLHIEIFLRDIELDDAKKYKEHLERLFNYPNEFKTFTFKYQDLVILEYMFAIKDNQNVSIYSYFIDITNYYNKENKLDIKANYDFETNLLNKSNFNENYLTFLEDKATLILLELNTSIRDIYGTERVNKFFIEYANITKKHFKDDLLYRYNNNQLLLVLKQNDIRTINNILNDYFSVINNIRSYTLKYETFNVKAGFLRYPVATTEKNIAKIYKYLDVALNESKISNKNYTDFTYSMYEKDVFEQEVIDYLNEAIENKKVSLRFNQIINIEKNTVLNYESEIYLPNINIRNEYLINIAKRRNKLIELDYFHVEMVASFLENLEKETNYYVNITIPVSEQTFNDNEFENYVSQIFKKYKVPLKYIKIFIDASLVKQKEIIKAEKLINYGINLETNDINTALNSNVYSLHLNYIDNKKHKNYYQMLNNLFEEENIKIIIKNVNNQNIKKYLERIKIKYISGELYKKVDSVELFKQIKGEVNESN